MFSLERRVLIITFKARVHKRRVRTYSDIRHNTVSTTTTTVIIIIIIIIIGATIIIIIIIIM